MIHVDIAQAMSGLDDDLLDEYLTLRAERNRRLERRRMIRKRCLTAAACLLVVLSVMAKAAFDCRYPYIPLENAVGDVSVRYVPEWMAEGTHGSFLPNYTDDVLFSCADYVFSGTVKKIEYIQIVNKRIAMYGSIVTIQVEHSFKGSILSEIRLFTPPISNDRCDSDTVLNSVKEGSQGIFIAMKVDSNRISINHTTVNISDFANAEIYDEYCFAFLYEETTDRYTCYDTIHNHADNFFSSLTEYDPKSVYQYIQKMTNED